ncbi:MAG: hypothetical protein VXZ59_03985 [Cyanobacteriota bacterium]|nr:hypothetical protein [Cyanobacteriota bacterium]
MTQWPQAPKARHFALPIHGMRHDPCSGVSEASNMSDDPIPVVGVLASQPLVTTRVERTMHQQPS